MLEKAYSYFYWGMLGEFDLSPGDALLMTLIKTLSKRTTACYASKETLAKILNLSVPTIYNALKRLKGKGLVDEEGFSKHGVRQLRVSEKWDQLIEEVNKEIEENKVRGQGYKKIRM